eukprot:1619017-Pyramimonas_sp.AAC.2
MRRRLRGRDTRGTVRQLSPSGLTAVEDSLGGERGGTAVASLQLRACTPRGTRDSWCRRRRRTPQEAEAAVEAPEAAAAVTASPSPAPGSSAPRACPARC